MEPIIGHDEVRQMFDRAATRDVLAHAYLLVGPQGIGKTTVARWVAQRLLCQERWSRVKDQKSDRNPSPCGTCVACAQAERGIHPDIAVVRADGGAIGVDAVRAWSEMLQFSSLLGGWKIGIVEDGSALTEPAANALLKFLEEPTPQTLLLVTATDARGVLPTVASRCAVVRLQRVPRAALAAALQSLGIADAERIAVLADGCPGRALVYVTDADARDVAQQRLAMAHECVGMPITKRLRLAEQSSRVWSAEKDFERARADVRAWIAAMAAAARAHIRRTPDGQATAWCAAVACAPRYLDANVAPRLVLESMVVAAP